MIEVWLVVSHGLWIGGLSIVLAVLSGARWIAGEEGVRLGAVLARYGPRRALDVGAAVFCSGLAATGRVWWEQVLWALLAAVWAARAWVGPA
jgi:hypothetical protein